MTAQQLTLPTTVATKAQLLSLRKNLDEVLETITQNQVRINENVDVAPPPNVSGALASLLSVNKLQPSLQVIEELKKWVEYLLHHAPVVRLTFSSEPGPKELARLIDWLRQNSEKVTLLHIGIQPTIAAGIIVRTTSHRYDLSLRADLLRHSQSFIDAVITISEKKQAAEKSAKPVEQKTEEVQVDVA